MVQALLCTNSYDDSFRFRAIIDSIVCICLKKKGAYSLLALYSSAVSRRQGQLEVMHELLM